MQRTATLRQENKIHNVLSVKFSFPFSCIPLPMVLLKANAIGQLVFNLSIYGNMNVIIIVQGHLRTDDF